MSGHKLLKASLTAIAVFAIFAPASFAAVPIDAGGISFGVTDYGNPVPGVPTFIPNNFTGLNDIMSSPGGTFLTANPILANNIASYPLAALPVAAVQAGGSNVNGNFGTGYVAISGPSVNFGITDPVAGGGSASYEIGSWTTNYTNVAGATGTFGNYLSIAGSLPAVGSAAAVSLVTEIYSGNPTSPFFGGVTLPALVLADSEVSAGNYSYVALGGAGAIVVTDGMTSTFEGLAVNSIPVIIPAGDNYTVTTTLTAYADPASINSIIPDLSLLPGVELPELILSGTTVPEPGAAALTIIAAISLLACRPNRRCIA